jgi:selenocysteine lyase/cysteine desulfurase
MVTQQGNTELTAISSRQMPTVDFPSASRAGYLNAAAIGLIAAPVLARHQAFGRDLAERGSAAFFDNVDAILKGPRIAGARLFGVDAINVAAATSVSEVISQIAWWLYPRAGQNVVSIDLEPEAVTLPWLRVAEDSGAQVRLASLREDPASLSLDRVAELVDRNTAAICLSHVQWITGYRFDLKALADLAHSHGALLVVDAMQSAGAVPIDAADCDVDVLVAGSYKWLCSFGGVAACYMRPELSERFRPTMVGARTSDPEPPYDDIDPRILKLPDGARRLEYASTAHPSRIAFTAAVEYLLGIGIENIQTHIQQLGLQLASGLLRLGACVVTPLHPKQRAGILSVAFEGLDAVKLASELAVAGVTVSPRLGMLRFSPHLFNTEEDIERALAVLDGILPTRGRVRR